MTPLRGWFALPVWLGLALSVGCSRQADTNAAGDNAAIAKSEDADAFVVRANQTFGDEYAGLQSAHWMAATDRGDDAQRIAAKANARHLSLLNAFIEESRRFDGQTLKPDTARAVQLLRESTATPAPGDPAKLAELGAIAERMQAMYGSGAYCSHGDTTQCRQLGDLEAALKTSRDYDAQLDAWTGWHATAMPMRKDYVRFVELVNAGAKQMGFANAGEMWRAGYDMSPTDFQTQTDKLWSQVKPLYDQLQCYTHVRLVKAYGARAQIDGMIPAHLAGNIGNPDWGSQWDLLAPYPTTADPDKQTPPTIDDSITFKQSTTANGGRTDSSPTHEPDPGMFQPAQLELKYELKAEDYFTSLGLPKLPESLWKDAHVVAPPEHTTTCDVRAWDMNLHGDLRVSMCVNSTTNAATGYRTVARLHAYLADDRQPFLFRHRDGDPLIAALAEVVAMRHSNDDAHPAGDSGSPPNAAQAAINAQMRYALATIAPMAFAMASDHWRWGVFDGSIKPADYNKAWWALRAKYEGIAPPTPRNERSFDAGAAESIVANHPNSDRFIAGILQFQINRALCKTASGATPRYGCDFEHAADAGKLYRAMLEQSASQPWQKTLKQFTGDDSIDAGAMLDYFALLRAWLEKQNKGEQCGWEGNFASGPTAPANDASSKK